MKQRWRKNEKRGPPTTEKASWNHVWQQKSHLKDKQLGSPQCRIHGTILEMSPGGTQSKRLNNKKVDDIARERGEESPALWKGSINQYKDNIKKSQEEITKAANNKIGNRSRDRTATKTRNQKYKEKQLYGLFNWQTGEIAHKKTWIWLRKESLKRAIKSLLKTAQNNTLKTNYLKSENW